MKIKTFLPSVSLAAALVASLVPSVSHGQVVYEDSFTSNPGSLNGRATASGFGSWVNSDGALQTGGGLMTVSTNSPVDYHSATFALPTLQSSEILTLSITVRPAGTGFLGIGFTESPGQFLINSGFSWMYTEGVGGQVPSGVQIFRGIGAQDNVYTGVPAGFDSSLSTTYTFVYDYSARTIGLSATNGAASIVFFSALDVAGLPTTAFNNFALQFQGQNLGSDPTASYVDYIRAEVVPEPSTNLLLALGASVLGVAWFRRSRFASAQQ